jgi:hypothetical protein
MPQPRTGAKHFIKQVCDQLRELVKALHPVVTAVEILDEAMVAHLVEPAGEVGYEAGLSGREVKTKNQQP